MQQLTYSVMDKVSFSNGREGAYVLGAFIDALTWDQAVERLAEWGARRDSRYVCICNVHSVVTGSQDPSFMEVLNDADMATADGTSSLRRNP